MKGLHIVILKGKSVEGGLGGVGEISKLMELYHKVIINKMDFI